MSSLYGGSGAVILDTSQRHDATETLTSISECFKRSWEINAPIEGTSAPCILRFGA